MAYCFDTSVLIECWSRSYPPDVFPGLWVKMDELITRQQVLCPEEVRVELARTSSPSGSMRARICSYRSMTPSSVPRAKCSRGTRF